MTVELILLILIVILVLGPPRLSVPENIKSVVDVVLYIIIAVIVIKLLLGLVHVG